MESGARYCGACGAPQVGDSAADLAKLRDPHRDPYVGMVLKGRFSVSEKIGEGGFGSVYRGIQLATGRDVAIKLLHPETTRDGNVLARFRREGQVLCALRDAHTVTTYDFDQTDEGTLFIAMELLVGRSLHDVFHDEAPIEPVRMLRILAQICSSLHEAHERGIVHRDLKPENIFLEPRPGDPEFVKILDFGVAKLVRGDGLGGSAQLTATGQTLGTLEYMSPEQLMGKSLDGRSDIYTLGVVCYELLSGRLPFPQATEAAALVSAQLRDQPKAPSKVLRGADFPPSVDELVLRMLAKHRDDRPQDVQEIQLICHRLLAQELAPPEAQVVAPRVIPPTQPVRPRRPSIPQGSETQAALRAVVHRPTWMWFVMVVALAGVIAAMVLVLR